MTTFQHSSPILRPQLWDPKDICSIGVRKLESLDYCKVMMSVVVSTHYTSVTDRWTDTARQHIPRRTYASRGKNHGRVLRQKWMNNCLDP